MRRSQNGDLDNQRMHGRNGKKDGELSRAHGDPLVSFHEWMLNSRAPVMLNVM